MANRRSSFCRKSERGIALLSALLILILLSALGVALLYKVTYEQHLQKSDSSNSVAYYGAQAAMEKMAADLDNLYAQQASPGWCDIQKLVDTKLQPTLADVNVTYSEYQITIPNAPTDCSAPPSSTSQISQGPNAGLYAQIVPLTLRVTADHQAGNQSAEEVRMVRQIAIAEIPVFQFGVYSTTDISFFAGPNMDFKGRVHTNSNLFLAEGSGATLSFHTPIRAAGDILRDQLANAFDATTAYTGTVLVPTKAGGCDVASPPVASTTCVALGMSQQSSKGGPSSNYGIPPGSGTEDTTNWPTTSNTTYNGMILSGQTGAKPLNMAFVQAGVGPIEILRRPAGEPGDSALSESRLYNQAQIRVLLSDDPAELPGGATDPQNIRLANVKTIPSSGTSPDYSGGVPVSTLGQSASGKTYFAEGNQSFGAAETNWKAAPGKESTLVVGGVANQSPAITSTTWNLLDGYLRVEYRASDGTYSPVTQEWLELGFARDFMPPTAAAPNDVHPNAILILQQLADRNGKKNSGLSNPLGGASPYLTGTGTRNNWYPINTYDIREGEMHQVTATGCRVGGVLNLIEIDVNNLKRWLAGTIGTNGKNVEYTSQNGYILYFSDRRGMILNPNLSPSIKNGEYGFEDVININTYTGTAGAPCPSSGTYIINGKPNKCIDTGEDVDQNGKLDTWGAADLGIGFGTAADPFAPVGSGISGCQLARANWVSGARHAVRLVDASLGRLPSRLDGAGGGFTLASENPAYILGNYNANSSGFGTGDGHVSSAVIADTVTMLSNSWTDWESFTQLASAGRPAKETWYRLAIASGKNESFPRTNTSLPRDYGTDGGVHNFLRYLEYWGDTTNSHYLGSMAAMYYSQYATGVFKCCGMVYDAPYRDYAFDTDFLDVNKLPPGTPRFRDVETIGFQQVF